MVIEPEIGSDTTTEHIAKMCEQNEKRNIQKRVSQAQKPKLRAGKEKESLCEEDILKLHQGWHDKFKDLLQGVPEKMPPFRIVNHEIPLIDAEKKYRYHLPKCPNSLKAEVNEKVEKYTWAGWWSLAAASQAALMLCLSKKDRHLRTVVNCRQHNENTVEDITPMPDQDSIREDVAKAKY